MELPRKLPSKTPSATPADSPDATVEARSAESLIDGAHGGGAALRLLSASQVAEFLGVHVKTVHRWRHSLGLPCVLVGRRVRFLPSEVTRWVSARKEG